MQESAITQSKINEYDSDDYDSNLDDIDLMLRSIYNESKKYKSTRSPQSTFSVDMETADSMLKSWWRQQNHTRFKLLIQNYFCITSSSSTAETAFSCVNLIYTNRRQAMKPLLLFELSFLKRNYKQVPSFSKEFNDHTDFDESKLIINSSQNNEEEENEIENEILLSVKNQSYIEDSLNNVNSTIDMLDNYVASDNNCAIGRNSCVNESSKVIVSEVVISEVGEVGVGKDLTMDNSCTAFENDSFNDIPL